jgi:anti-anti-sigma factor
MEATLLSVLNIDVVAATEGPLNVRLSGDMDHRSSEAFRAGLGAVLARGRPVVVDLTGVSFLDSSGLGALLDARRRAIEATQGFVVCVGETVEPGVQRILDITGLVPVLPVMRGRDEAIATARGNGASA